MKTIAISFAFFLSTFCFKSLKAQSSFFDDSPIEASIKMSSKSTNSPGYRNSNDSRNGHPQNDRALSDAPVNGGIAVILVAGIVAGFKKVRDRQQEASKLANSDAE